MKRVMWLVIGLEAGVAVGLLIAGLLNAASDRPDNVVEFDFPRSVPPTHTAGEPYFFPERPA